MRSRDLKWVLSLAILAGLGLNTTAGADDREFKVKEIEVPALFHSPGAVSETGDKPSSKLLPPELERFSAALTRSNNDDPPIFINDNAQSSGICRSAPALLKSAEDIGSAPLFEMAPINFKYWRESTGELVNLTRILHKECNSTVRDGIDGRFGMVKAQFEKLLSMRQ